jgi:ABC-type antimicrobial peptide transport system permease subunit
MRIVERPMLGYYEPLAQASAPFSVARVLWVRTAPGSTKRVRAAIRRLVATTADGNAAWDIREFAELLQPELQPWRVTAGLFACLGILAAVVAGVGIYGTVGYETSQRFMEIGIRRALGADGVSIMRLVVWGALARVLLGVAIGAGLALAMGRVAGTLLYGVSPLDPPALAGAAAGLAVIAAIACVVPVRRSVRVDPRLVLDAG